MVQSYKSKEINLGGSLIENFYKGESKEEVLQQIRNKGHTPVKIELVAEEAQDIKGSFFQKKVKIKDISVFCKQLHTMLAAGMPLISALTVLGDQSENQLLRKTIDQMITQVQMGNVLSIAMKQHPKVFPTLLINMVEAGEMTGNLDDVLDKMAEHYNKENKINASIRGAMIYPAVLGILVVVVVVFMLVFIFPTFLGMFEGSGVKLPGPTRFLIGLSDAIKHYWYIMIGVIIALVVTIKRVTATKEGKRAIDRFMLKVPVAKKSLKQIATSRFTRTLSTLLGSGIPIIEALEAAGNVTNNMIVIDGVEEVSEEIKKGTPLSILLKRMNFFPPMMLSMVSVGEESGSLDEMLSKTADFYDDELEVAIAQMIKLIEPLMIVVMAVIIGFIAVAMVMPMFDMLKTVS